jgi:hypothetical protein
MVAAGQAFGPEDIRLTGNLRRASSTLAAADRHAQTIGALSRTITVNDRYGTKPLRCPEALAALGPAGAPDVRGMLAGTLLYLRDTYPLETAWRRKTSATSSARSAPAPGKPAWPPSALSPRPKPLSAAAKWSSCPPMTRGLPTGRRKIAWTSCASIRPSPPKCRRRYNLAGNALAGAVTAISQ